LSKHVVDLQLDNKIKVHCGVIRKRDNMYVGSSHQWREKLIKVMHDSRFGRHSEILGTYQRVKRFFYWPGLKFDVLTHVQSCEAYQMNKSEHVGTPGLLKPIPIPNGAWEV
jgi:Integrase zinc binding domain